MRAKVMRLLRRARRVSSRLIQAAFGPALVGFALWWVDLADGAVERVDMPGICGASHGTIDAAARWLAFDSRE